MSQYSSKRSFPEQVVSEKGEQKGGILFLTSWKAGKKEQGILERNFISMW